jgi:hypothetical protein
MEYAFLCPDDVYHEDVSQILELPSDAEYKLEPHTRRYTRTYRRFDLHVAGAGLQPAQPIV